MHSVAGIIGQLIGFALYVTVLADFYYFLPKRVAQWEQSEALEDKKKLERYKRAIEVYKAHWGMRILLVFFAIWFISTVADIITMKL